MLLSDGGSPVLASWNTSSHFCRWSGVACSRQKQVVALRLGLQPARPHLAAPGKPVRPHGLDLGGNRLSGEIPPELGHLSSLRSLNLSGNFLTGAIPRPLRRGAPTSPRSSWDSNRPLEVLIPAQIGHPP
ncbi:hypothetical protein ZWY2020_034972 [Hordeum vulgare]|nr:hypothetical protein ZWY2020_034972 [Hordeum vulgare]